MYRVYKINFAPNSRIESTPLFPHTFELLLTTDQRGTAFGFAKGIYVDRKDKTIIIDDSGTPIGGY
jgi:hypothetical protein